MLYLGTEGEDRVELKTSRLTTHGVILGMTGSGKTGLGLVLLEELARAKVPIIAIDPKGDLANLALLFPDLDEPSFKPWVEDEDEAAATAAQWKSGLARSGLSGDDVQAIKASVDVRVYTPGSTAGTPVNLLAALRCPKDMSDPEANAALVQSTVTSLLGLAGRKPDPLRDPAHIVLSQIVNAAWTAGEDPELETLILRLVDPPFDKVGVFPLDKFLPPDERMEVAMALNAVIASPSFAAWKTGISLDPAPLLKPRDDGRTPVSIFHIAHLDDVQRTFFISLLLGRLLAHSRQLPGTSDLRGLVYFDEVAGYLPPHPKNPPTKQPLLTMMKQARAVGIGFVLSTQNPVDVDYKALSNAGLWCIGRLQTQQDRDRVLKGMGRKDLDDEVESLKKREFVVFDAKEDQPRIMKTRHAMCFLRGPMTRVELKQLTKDDPKPTEAPAPAATAKTEAKAVVAPKSTALAAPPVKDALYLDPRVVFSNAIGHVFAPHAQPPSDDETTHYLPALWADVALRFDEDRVGFILDRRERRLWFPLPAAGPGEPVELPLPASAFGQEPEPGARYEPLPAWCDEDKELKKLKKALEDDLYRNETEGRFVHKKLKLNSKAGESRDAFAARVSAAAAELIDDKKAKLHERYQKKVDTLEDRLARAQHRVADLEGALRANQTEELVDIGSSILGMFTGSRRSTSTRVTRAVRKRTKSSRAGGKVTRAQEKVADVEADLVELQQDLEDDFLELDAEVHEAVDDIEEKEVRLERADVRVERFSVLWVPVTRRV